MKRAVAEHEAARERGGPVADDRSVVQALDEFLAAVEAGQQPDRAAFLAAHAEIAEPLAKCLDGLAFIQDARPALQESALTPAVLAGPAVCTAPLGDYRLIREIGRGGMGIVYEAEQLSLGRRVALKVLPFASTLDPRQLQRFKNESHAAAQLQHPNIVPVYATGCDRGVHYYAMQLVDGQTLADLISGLRRDRSDMSGAPPDVSADTGAALTTQPARSRPSSVDSRLVAQIGIQAAEALEYAHQLGIIHRDIKPGNLLLDNCPLRVWITDFGLAHCQNQAGPTMTGDLVGTLRYMSPEQALANRAMLDQRTDVYSLGATLYELLTLEAPWPGQDRQELLRQIANEEPRPLRRLRAEVPAELETIVLKAMEKQPSDRYGSAQAMADDLRRYLSDEPIRARRATVRQRLQKWARRHRAVVRSAGVAVLVSLAIVAGCIGWNLRDRAARHAEITFQVQESMTAAHALVADNRLVAARRKLAEARGRLGQDAAVLGSVAADLEAFEGELERYQRFLRLIEQAHEEDIAEPLLGWTDADATRLIPLLLKALACYEVLERADWHADLGHGFLASEQTQQIKRSVYEELLYLASDVLTRRTERESGTELTPEAAARRALVFLAEAAKAHPSTQTLYQLRSRCHLAIGDKEAARGDAELARSTAPTMAVDHYLRGRQVSTRGSRADSIKAFQDALALDPAHYWSMMWLGRNLLVAGGSGQAEWTAAAVAFTGCIMRRPDHAEAYLERGHAYARMPGRQQAALDDLSRSIALKPELPGAWQERGRVYLVMRQWDSALADLSRALELNPTFGYGWSWTRPNLRLTPAELADLSRAVEAHPDRALGWQVRGLAHLHANQGDRALADFATASKLEPRLAAVAAYNCAFVHLRQGQGDAAAAECSRALALDPKHETTYLLLRADVYRQMRQWDQAFADCNTILKRNARDLQALEKRAHLNRALQRFDEALADFSTMIRIDPQNPRAWLNRGNVNMELRRWEKALSDYTAAVNKNPKNAAAWSKRGAAAAKLGDWRSALAWFSRAYELGSHSSEPTTDLAWALICVPDAALRDVPRALALATQTVDKAPTYGKAWSVLGVARYRMGRWQPAADALRTAVELRDGGDCVDWLFLAMAHARLRSKDEAQMWYDKAAAWMESNPPEIQLERFRKEAAGTLGLKKAP
jgi:serine/threonine protein kinase/Tfp pilus assembly protein PilF